MRVFVIVPAAGLGTRMATGNAPPGAPKQFLELRGVPILIHTLRAFTGLAEVSGVYIAVRKPEVARLRALLDAHEVGGQVHVIEGGDTRQESVAHALAAVDGDADDIVLVHDAVRPLIDAATIARTIEAVERQGAAIVALPAVDTIKQVERTAHGAIITATIPREYVVLAQTPQGFRLGLLRRAFAEAEADGFQGTDESSIVERAGLQVAVVPGTVENLKITQQGDLDLAEFFLSRREKARG
jgi:2-C-methyl-D-erythritol 4-phosphate cytidylyltransferase